MLYLQDGYEKFMSVGVTTVIQTTEKGLHNIHAVHYHPGISSLQ